MIDLPGLQQNTFRACIVNYIWCCNNKHFTSCCFVARIKINTYEQRFSWADASLDTQVNNATDVPTVEDTKESSQAGRGVGSFVSLDSDEGSDMSQGDAPKGNEGIQPQEDEPSDSAVIDRGGQPLAVNMPKYKAMPKRPAALEQPDEPAAGQPAAAPDEPRQYESSGRPYMQGDRPATEFGQPYCFSTSTPLGYKFRVGDLANSVTAEMVHGASI